MGRVPKPLLSIIWICLVVAAGTGFYLGFTQSDRKAVSADTAPIAADLPANVVIKDATPLAAPPPPPPKAKVADDQSDEAPASDQTPIGVGPVAAPQAEQPLAPPPTIPAPLQTNPQLPADLPPT